MPFGKHRWLSWRLICLNIKSTSPLQPPNVIWRNFIGSKNTTSSSKFVFLGRSENRDGHPGLWLAETFSASSFKPLNGIWKNLTGNKILTASTKSVYNFGVDRKKIWWQRLLIGCDIFDASSVTTERKMTKLDMKQVDDILYQVCVFQTDQKTNMGALASD